MDDQKYLQPGFDPNTLKVAELRGILLVYDVDFPSSAKKAQLVELFKENIIPQSQTLLGAQSRVRASTRGIQDVDQNGNAIPPSATAATPSPRKRSRSTRRTTTGRYGVMDSIDVDDMDGVANANASDGDVLDSVTISPVKLAAPVSSTMMSPTKRASSRRSLAPTYGGYEVKDDGEREESPGKSVKRSTRKSLPVRSGILHPYDPEPEPSLPPPPSVQSAIRQDDESVFSMENPFQSGSSPVSLRSPGISRDSRRKSMPRTGNFEKSATKPSSRRVTDFPTPVSHTSGQSRLSGGPYDTPVAAPSHKRFEFPVSRVQQQQPQASLGNSVISSRVKKEEEETNDDYHYDQDLDHESQEVEPGEEFTPEATQELLKLEQEGGAVVRRRPSPRNTHSPGPASLLWVVIGTLLSAYFMWWRKEKIEIGYCDIGRALYNPHHDDPAWAAALRPNCEPCPTNAICKPNFEVECKDDYVLVANPLSFGGLIPLPPSCEPDSEKLRRIQILSDELLRILRQREADVVCGKVALGQGEPRGCSVADLKERLYAQKAPKLTDAQFDDLFNSAVEDVVSKEEIENTEVADAVDNSNSNPNSNSNSDNKNSQTVHNSTTTTHLRSTSHSHLPLTCSLKLTLLTALIYYKTELSLLVLLLISSTYLSTRITQKREYNKQVSKYVHLALQILARQNGNYVAVVQLRDQVLQHEFDAGKRKRLWDGVQRVVEGNSNVRSSSREIVGEVLRCWCWIGPSGGVIAGGGDGGGESRRQIEGNDAAVGGMLTREEKEERERDVLYSRGRILA